MKTLIALLLALPMLAVAQTNTTGLGPNVDAVADFLSKGSNWMAVSYGLYDSGAKKYGGGIGLAYKISEYAAPVMRLELFEHSFYMPSASFQLQLPIKVGPVTAVPFAFSGIATPIGGAGSQNGSLVGIFGTGAALRISKHFDLIGDAEKWSEFKGMQYRFGLLYKF